jgi:hypothetical protein
MARRSRSGPAPRLSPYVVASLAAVFMLSLAAVSAIPASALPVTPGPAAVDREPPAKWDGRVADLADFVERKRGLDFEHPVPVRFLTESQFTKELQTDESDLTAQDKKDFEQTAGLFRAVGLSQVDAEQLLEDFDAVSTADTAAFYDQEKQEIVTRGKKLDVATKVTVVHELTHALQDQRFDLDKLDARAGSSGAEALLALVEGDAVRIEDEYLATLGQREQDEFGKALDTQIAGSEAAVPADAPAVLAIIDYAPYSIGPTFVEAVAIQDGEKAVDDAFRKPPTSDKQVLNPSSYLDRENPKRVRAPKLGPGEKRVGKPDTFGALGLYLTLAGRLDPAIALPTIRSWGGDSYAQFTRGDTACVRAAFTGEDARATEQIAASLDQWVAAGPAGAASVERTDGAATLTTCDPGQAADDEKVNAAGDVLDARSYALSGSMTDGAPIEAAECVADRASVDPDLRAFLVSVDEPPQDQIDAFLDKIAGVERACAA